MSRNARWVENLGDSLIESVSFSIGNTIICERKRCGYCRELIEENMFDKTYCFTCLLFKIPEDRFQYASNKLEQSNLRGCLFLENKVLYYVALNVKRPRRFG